MASNLKKSRSSGPADARHVKSDAEAGTNWSLLKDLDHVSKELEDATNGDRESALEMWRSVAQGYMGPEERVWVQYVALSLLEADEHPKTVRARSVTKAVGLEGNRDVHRRLRQHAASLRSFGLKVPQIIDVIEQSDFGIAEDVDTRSLIGRELAKAKRRK